MEDPLFEICDKVKTKEDFIKFIDLLKEDFVKNKEHWESQSVDVFLDTMGVWTEAMLEQSYENGRIFFGSEERLPENIPWKVFANIIFSAKFYE